MRDGIVPADDPMHPGLFAHVTLVEPSAARSLSLLEQKLVAKIEKEQLELFGGNMLVIAVMPKNDGEEERWPIGEEYISLRTFRP